MGVDPTEEVTVRQDFAGEPARLAAPRDARVFEGRAARVHRPGDPLKYRWGEEYRDLAELERMRSLVVGKPMTLLHPDGSPENKHGMITAGAEGHVAGQVLSARVDGDWLVIEFLVDDDEALRAIADGMIELSVQYACRSDASKYQRGTIVDSVGIVPRGRCGGTCALRADCSDANSLEDRADQSCTCKARARQLAKSLVTRQSVDHMDPDDLKKQLADAQAEAAALRARADEAEKVRDAEKARADAHELEAYNAKKDLAKRADAEKKAVDEAVTAEKTRADRAEMDLDKMRVERDNAQKRFEDLTAEHDAKVAQIRADEAAKHDEAVKSKLELLSLVAPLKLEFKNEQGEKIEIFRVDDASIKLAAIKHVDGEDLSSKPHLVEGAFYSAMKRAESATQSRADAEVAVVEMRASATTPNPLTSRAATQRVREQQAAKLAGLWMTTDTEKKDQ